MKNLQWILFLVVIFAYVWNEYREDIQHNEFFHDMRDFANRGDRFTLQDGLLLCEVISEEHETHGLSAIDCDELFTVEEGQQ